VSAPVTTKPSVAVVNQASFGGPPPVAGSIVREANRAPPSSVRSTDPSSRIRKPTSLFAKCMAASGEPQLAEGLKRRRRIVCPPSSERSSVHPPPARNVLASTTRSLWRSSISPLRTPAQFVPPSSVRSTVPNSPTA
jgi:hypothetical protein